ncbi:hypothetical protein FB45DRAFT_111220 [Roridomyces roridus]|uniref:Uncharacterized protein n=1 Tax=Roridomyces roridus TaxID=1738132 RepID=A0AAD7BKD4_9AGAR|nr:hypothetical protein FB45DRAFT_111220 [Roridomyces roridus]
MAEVFGAACIDVCAAVCAGFCLDFATLRHSFTETLCSCSCCRCCRPLQCGRDAPPATNASQRVVDAVNNEREMMIPRRTPGCTTTM